MLNLQYSKNNSVMAQERMSIMDVLFWRKHICSLSHICSEFQRIKEENIMRKCPKCGCTEFIGTQVQRHWVILDGNGKFIRNDGCENEDQITGPYVCRGCNTEYRS